MQENASYTTFPIQKRYGGMILTFPKRIKPVLNCFLSFPQVGGAVTSTALFTKVCPAVVSKKTFSSHFLLRSVKGVSAGAGFVIYVFIHLMASTLTHSTREGKIIHYVFLIHLLFVSFSLCRVHILPSVINPFCTGTRFYIYFHYLAIYTASETHVGIKTSTNVDQ